MHKFNIGLFVFFLLPACSSGTVSGQVVFDTSFHGSYYGNVYRDESKTPEGFIDYGGYFKNAEAYFYLDGTCKYLLSERNSEGEFIESIEDGTYTATTAYAGGGFEVKFTNGRTTRYTWEPNWHDPASTPYELSEHRTMTLKATGETVDLVFAYVSDYTSEM